LLAILGGVNVVTVASELCGKNAPQVGFVVNDQNLLSALGEHTVHQYAACIAQRVGVMP
jgi:hypothetical protein